MWIAVVQISMRIHAVWSGHSLFIDLYYNIRWFMDCSFTVADKSLFLSPLEILPIAQENFFKDILTLVMLNNLRCHAHF